jgi:hypothetical protein
MQDVRIPRRETLSFPFGEESLKLSQNILIDLVGFLIWFQFRLVIPAIKMSDFFLSYRCVFELSSFCLVFVRRQCRTVRSNMRFELFFSTSIVGHFLSVLRSIRRPIRRFLVNHRYLLDSPKPPPRFQFICYKVDSSQMSTFPRVQ